VLSSFVLASDQFRDAVAAFERGDLASAEQTLNSVLQSQPDDAAALGLLGAVLDAEKKYPEADGAYRHALKLTPNSASLLNNFGNHLLATGSSVAARAAFLKVVALRPDHANANLQLAIIFAGEKKGVEALHFLNHLPPSDQNAPQATILRMQSLYLCGRTQEANQILARLSDSAKNDPRLAFSTGLALAATERYQEAERLFSLTLESAPGNFDVLYNLGLAAFHAGDTQRAHDVLQTALAARPQDVDTLYNLAVVDIKLRESAAAIPLLSQAARLDASRANVQLTLAGTLSALGYYADAIAAYEDYLKLVPGDASAQRERAFMIAVCGQREDGLAKLQTFLRAHPRDADAYYEIAVLEATSEPAAAAKHFDQALTLQPDFVPARFGRGVLASLQGNSSAALPDLEFAAAQYPDNATVLDRLGKNYLELNRFTDAVRVLRKASDLSPNDPRVLIHLSRALAGAGQKEEARAVLDRFRAVGADQADSASHIPAPGFAELLSLPPQQLYQQYRTDVESRIKKEPQDPDVNLRYLNLLIGEGKTDEVHAQAAHLLSLTPQALVAGQAGRALLDAEDYTDAKALLEYAAAATTAPDVRIDLAIAIFHTGSAEQGLEQLERLSEAQRSGDYYLARAQMLDSVGRVDDALSDLRRALSAAPTRFDLYQQTAMLLVKRQRPVEAVGLVDEASRALPENRDIQLLKAAIFAFARRVGDAEATLKQIQSHWPEWAASYVTYGVLLAGQKRSDEAKTQLETALALGASSAEVYFYLAKATMDATPDRIDDAAKDITQAIALAPADPRAQALAGRIDYEKRDYKAAVEHLNEAIRLRPNYLQARFTLAEAYRALGMKDDANREAEQFRRLREQNPNLDDEAPDADEFLLPAH